RRPSWRARVERAHRHLARHDALFIVGFRFVYGIRTAAPFAIGASSVPRWRFAALNACGSAVWTLIFGLAGFAFGQALETALGRVEHYEAEVMAAIAAAGVATWLTYAAHRRHQLARR